MNKLLYTVGDIHGCYNTLVSLMQSIHNNAGGETYKVVFLGDYIDRGPASAEVVGYLNHLRLNPGENEYVFLKGNHEDMLIKGYLNQTSREHYSMFMYNGGRQTIESYDNMNLRVEDHRDFYESLERYHRHGDFFFVHANLAPTETMDEALIESAWSEDGLLWDRVYNEWQGEFPENVFVIHGHTPVAQIDILPNQLNIDTGCVFGREYSEQYGWLTAARLDSRDDFEFIQKRREDY